MAANFAKLRSCCASCDPIYRLTGRAGRYSVPPEPPPSLEAQSEATNSEQARTLLGVLFCGDDAFNFYHIEIVAGRGPSATKRLARRMAANFAKLPKLRRGGAISQ
jgi:hypothetical protein